MKSLIKIILLFLLLINCSSKNENIDKREVQFTSELHQLKDYFQIPGLAISVEKNGETIYKNYLGVADIEEGKTLESTTLFPIASVTKVFTGVLIMKLAEQKKISLETPINTYFEKPVLGDSILVKHVLSHTSQGKVGKEFYYSSRFGLLTQVIEKATGKSFANAMNEEIFMPLRLENTFLLKDSTQLIQNNKSIAKPYILDNGIENGFIDYGYSSSAGIVSNLDDLALFNKALDNNSIISKASKDVMLSSFSTNLPYGYGIFNQQFDNINIVWAYGQYDCYSSLFFKIPSQGITFTLLANNNLLSDPARLIYGDAMSSLFAISFLKNYIYEVNDMELFENLENLPTDLTSNKEFYRKKLLAQALAESYMARYNPEKMKNSANLLKLVFLQYPDYLEYADLNLLHNLSFLKDIAFYMELGDFNDFDSQIIAIGEKLLNEHPKNPYVNIYLGTFYDRNGEKDKAKYYFENIVNAKNFSKNWYTAEAANWLKAN